MPGSKKGPSFVLLGAASVELAIVQIPSDVSDTIEITTPAAARESTPIKLSFLVPSIEGARSTIEELGGALKPANAAWSWRGALHLDGKDMEGNVFQLREHDD